MNIPMAYDVVPSDTRGQGVVNQQLQAQQQQYYAQNPYHQPNQPMQQYNSGQQQAYSQPYAQQQYNNNQTGQHSSSLSAPLIPSEAESAWAQEMQAEGVGHLPLTWYRQTPKQAVWSGYGIINRVVGAMFNFGVNVGLGYAILHNNDEVGLWYEPSEWGEHPYKSAAWSDILLTCFMVVFFTVVLSTKGIRDAMKKGQTVPVDSSMLQSTQYRYLPMNTLGTCSRALLLALWACAILGLGFLLFLEVICLSGGLHGHHSQCSMEKVVYIYIKAIYAVLVGWITYPYVLLMTLNTHTLPPLDLTFFVQNQRERWEKQEREKQLAGQPL